MKKLSLFGDTILGFIILVATGTGCASKPGPYDAALTPLSASIQETATARAGSSNSDDTLQTAIAVATQRGGEIHATQTAIAQMNEPSRLATATAIAPVVAELPRYGANISDGYVAWLHTPTTIEISGYMSSGYANDYPLITGKDFIMAADVSINSVGSMSGCGFMFRSNGDMEEPDQYSVLLTRVATGYIAFMATADGDIANFSYYFPRDIDKSFDWFNNATNRLAVVARGNYIDMYTNGHLIAQVDVTLPPPNTTLNLPKAELPPGASAQQQEDFNNLNAQYGSTIDLINSQLGNARAYYSSGRAIYSDGLLGFIAFNETGTMTCSFTNAWLFILTP